MAGRRRARRDHELDRRRRDLHPGGRCASAQSTGTGAEPADDAAELRGADQRHDDAGRDRAEPRGQRELVRQGAEGFHFFSFTPFGVPVLVLGIVYMLFARRWLAATSRRGRRHGAAPSLRDWIEQYQLADREYRVRVTDRLAAGRQDASRSCRLRARPAPTSSPSSAAAASRRDLIRPTAQTELQAGDILLVDLFGAGRRHRGAAAASSRSRRCRSPGGATSPTARRRSAWSRSSCPPTRSWSARRCVEAQVPHATTG